MANVGEQQEDNYKVQYGTVVTVRCAQCNERRPGTLSTSFLELEFSEPPWKRRWRAFHGEALRPQWWPKLIEHRSALSAYRANKSAGLEQWRPTRGGVPRSAGSLATISRQRLKVDAEDDLAFSCDETVDDLMAGLGLPTVEDALKHRVAPKDPDDNFAHGFNPARALELGPCRGSRCKNRPRVKLRDLYARAEAAARAGGESVYV